MYRSSLDVQPKEEMEIFGSPLDSPSKFGSQQCYAEVGTDNIISVDSERQNMTYDDSDNENVASSSAELPRIQLTSHASLCTPVQSDSTNRVIYSSSVFPSATTSGLSLSIHDVDRMENTQRPTSSLVFSPPLTRSAVRRWVRLKCTSIGHCWCCSLGHRKYQLQLMAQKLHPLLFLIHN